MKICTNNGDTGVQLVLAGIHLSPWKYFFEQARRY